MVDLIHTYSSAGTFPVKLLQHRNAVTYGAILPIHLQLSITNRCNRSCRFCSYVKRNKSLELSTEEVVQILTYFSALGTRAVTFTGGGEPTVHEGFPEIIDHAHGLGLDLALVTNGVRIAEDQEWASKVWWKKFQWIRVSVIEDLFALKWLCGQKGYHEVSASFVVDESTTDEMVERLCRFTQVEGKMSHTRFVPDLLTLDDSRLNTLAEKFGDITSKAIFQQRSRPGPGQNPCLIAQLKPWVDADGGIYPCCGVQYATDEQPNIPEWMRRGEWHEFPKLTKFDGSRCIRCWYGEYNRLLEYWTRPLKHKNFL